MSMSAEIIGVIGIIVLVGLLLSRMWIGLAMGLVGFLGFTWLTGIAPGLKLLATVPYTTLHSYNMSPIPLFIFMGTIVGSMGIGEDLYKVANVWIGHFRGGLTQATTLACAAAHRLGLDVYVVQATMDTRPEDLVITPVLGPDAGVRYMASPLVTAMIRGGVAVVDEGNRMSERSWASLAPLLDHRRTVDSVVAGITVAAVDEFRFVTTMNEDASTFEVPEYIHSRLMPQIFIDFPEEDDERSILTDRVPELDQEVLDYVVGFLRAAHLADLRYSVRDGINIARYAMKTLRSDQKLSSKDAINGALILGIGREEAEPFLFPSV
jgi:hypothetical protein